MEKTTWRAHVFVLLATVLVSTTFPIGAAITQGLDSVVLTLLRFSLAALLFGPIVAWRYGLPLPAWRDLVRYAVISAFLVGFFWGMFAALRYTSALNTGTIYTLTPAIAAIVSYLLLRERLGPAARIALPVGIVGAIWVIFRGDPAAFFALEIGKGDAIFLGACLAMGCYMPLVKFLHRGEPMARMTFWTLTTGSGWLLLLSVGRLEFVDWKLVPISVYGGIVYLAIFTTVITFFIFQAGTAVIGATRVLSYTYLNPALVLLIGLCFGDPMPPIATYPGLVLILSATFILQRTKFSTGL